MLVMWCRYVNRPFLMKEQQNLNMFKHSGDDGDVVDI
jgi:hypothetical protein